jgi:hypothetical protein
MPCGQPPNSKVEGGEVERGARLDFAREECDGETCGCCRPQPAVSHAIHPYLHRPLRCVWPRLHEHVGSTLSWELHRSAPMPCSIPSLSCCAVLLQTPAFTTRTPETRKVQVHSILSAAAINAVDQEPMLRPVVQAALFPGVWLREVSVDRLVHACIPVRAWAPPLPTSTCFR